MPLSAAVRRPSPPPCLPACPADLTGRSPEQEAVHTARNIPDAEIQQHNREVGAPNAEERVSPRQAHMLMDITGHVLVPAQRHPGLQHIAAAAKHKHAAPWHLP